MKRYDQLKNKGGGVALYYKDDLATSGTERPDLVPPIVEGLCMELNLLNKQNILISKVYRPPHLQIAWFNHLEQLLINLDAEGKEYIIIGDFNCDLMKSPVYNHTKQLITLCEIHHLIQHIDKPTQITPNSCTLLDLVLSSTPEKITSHGVIHCAIADHYLSYACKHANHQKVIKPTSPLKPGVLNILMKNILLLILNFAHGVL